MAATAAVNATEPAPQPASVGSPSTS